MDAADAMESPTGRLSFKEITTGRRVKKTQKNEPRLAQQTKITPKEEA